MKNFLFIFSFVFVNSYCIFAQGNFEIKDKERISKNNIRIQTQWSYDYEQGKPSEKGYISSQTTFDKNGNIIQIVNFKANGQITSVLTYTFDKNGNKTSYSRFKGNKDELTYNLNLIYNEKGNKMGESGFDGMSHFLNIFLYDTNDKLIEIRYTTDKILNEKRVLTYFDNKVELIVLSPTNTILSKEITAYDAKNNILEELKYIQGNVSQKYNYQYNIAGKKIEETKINFGNFSYRKKYVYENDGKLLQVIEETPEGQIYTSFEYKYDSRGNVIEEHWTKDPSSEYSRKNHTYDSTDLLIETDSYSASYNFSVLYKYTYQKY